MVKYYEFTNPVTNEVTKFELTIDSLTSDEEATIEEFLKLTKRDIIYYPEFSNMILEECDGLLTEYFRVNFIEILGRDFDVKEMLDLELNNLEEPLIKLPRNNTGKKYNLLEEIESPDLIEKLSKVNEMMILFSKYDDSQVTLGQEIMFWIQQIEMDECGTSWFNEDKLNAKQTLSCSKTLLNILRSSKSDVNTPLSKTDVYNLFKETLADLNKKIYGKG